MASSQYSPQYPSDTPFKSEYKDFISEFYKISDTPDAHEKYSTQFSPSARIQMGPKTASGRENILALREGMWEKISSRSHVAEKVFPFGPDSDEIMLYGTVEYGFKEGGAKSKVDWTAKGKLGTHEGKVVWEEYFVYLGIQSSA